MEEILRKFVGRKLDVNCGSNAVYRGEIVQADSGVLTIKNEEGTEVFISIERISAFSECKDFGSRPGFIV